MNVGAGFRHPLRVYWEDTDAGGVVYHANHLRFFERARTEWLRAMGVEQQRLRDAAGVICVVADVRVRYLRPARLDDALSIGVALLDAGRASLRLAQQSWRGDELLADGEVRIGCIDAATLRPARFPPDLANRLLPR